MNEVNIGYANREGVIRTQNAMGDMPEQDRERYRPMLLGPDETRYISVHGSIYNAREIHHSHRDIQGSLRKLDGGPAVLGWVSQRDGTLYYDRAEISPTQDVREVDLTRIRGGYRMAGGRIITDASILPAPPPHQRGYYTPVDLSRVDVGYLSLAERVFSDTPGQGRIAVDRRWFEAGYVSLEGYVAGQQQYVPTAANVGSSSTQAARIQSAFPLAPQRAELAAPQRAAELPAPAPPSSPAPQRAELAAPPFNPGR